MKFLRLCISFHFWVKIGKIVILAKNGQKSTTGSSFAPWNSQFPEIRAHIAANFRFLNF